MHQHQPTTYPTDAAVGGLMLACQGLEAGLTWLNIISAILEKMEDHIQELLALGISTEEKKE
jgi:hypothetical protein